MKRTFKVALKWILQSAYVLALLAMAFQVSCRAKALSPLAEQKKQSKEVMRLTVPDPSWHWQVERIIERDRAVWIFTSLRRSPGSAAQIITTLELSLPIELPPGPKRIFVTGKTWAWKNDEPYEFVANFNHLLTPAEGEQVLYPLHK